MEKTMLMGTFFGLTHNGLVMVIKDGTQRVQKLQDK